MPELIEPNRTGLLVEDFVEGRHVIQQCFAMNREYVASRARQLFNYQAMASQYLEVYRKVIADVATRPIRSKTFFNRAVDGALNWRSAQDAPLI